MSSLNIQTRKKGLFFEVFSQFLSNKEINLLIIYISFFFLFSLKILPKDLILGLIAVTFAVSSLKCSLLMFLFFALWENVAVFSFGITLNIAMQIVLFLKIFFNSIQGNRTISYRYVDLIFLIVVFFYGVMNYLIGAGGFSGIGIGFKVFIAIYAFSIYKNQEQSAAFWKSVFYILMISTILATFYGFSNVTANDRWIRGMGYVKQLYGTVGTARMGMYYCVSLIYPMFYINNKVIKIMLSLMFSILALMTLSITTLICLTVFWVIIFLLYDTSKFKNNAKKVLIIVFYLIATTMLWPVLQEISFVKPLDVRISGMLDAYKAGDLTKATSTRSLLVETYINDFKELAVTNKIFGSFYINRISDVTSTGIVGNYAHNSFVDILLYAGVFGLIAFVTKIITRLRFLRKRREFLPILLLKLMFILTGLSVSMLSSTYWFIWIVL